jgi:hypothetical protein
VKFSQGSGSGKKDEKSEPVSVRFVPPKWEPVLGERTHVIGLPFILLSSRESSRILSSSKIEVLITQKVVLKSIREVRIKDRLLINYPYLYFL